MSIRKQDFAENLKSKADTILWEEVRIIIRKLEQEKADPGSAWHWMNAAYYNEFVRRDKIGAYFNAHNKELFAMGKGSSAISI